MNLQDRLLEAENENVLLKSELRTLYDELELKSQNDKSVQENSCLRSEIWCLNQKINSLEQQKQELTLKLMDQQDINITLNKKIQELQSDNDSNEFYQKQSCILTQANQSNGYQQQLQVLRQRYQNRNDQVSYQKDYEIAKLYNQLSELQQMNQNRNYKFVNNENIVKPQNKLRGVSEHRLNDQIIIESRIFR